LLGLRRRLLPVGEIRFLETTHQTGLVALSIGILPRCPYSAARFYASHYPRYGSFDCNIRERAR